MNALWGEAPTPPKKSISTVAPAFQSPPILGPSNTSVRRVLRMSPPPNQQLTSQFGGLGNSAFCPLPKLKLSSWAWGVNLTKPLNVRVPAPPSETVACADMVAATINRRAATTE